MSITSNARRGTAIVASLAAAALLTLGTAGSGSAAGSRDSDHDGMPNTWELRHGLDPHHANANGNPDHDGLRNLGEFRHGTRPHDSDSDDDEVEDGMEVHDGCDSTDPTDADTDDDGVEDGMEDTDHDGIDDAEDEVEDNCDDDAELEGHGGHGGTGLRAPVVYVVR